MDFDAKVEKALTEAGIRFSKGGLNADWNCTAWALVGCEDCPCDLKDTFVLDDENNETVTVVYRGEGEEDEVKVGFSKVKPHELAQLILDL